MNNYENSINEFNLLVGTDSLKARNVILKLNFKNDGYLLSCIALTYRDEAMFFKNGNRRKWFVREKLLVSKNYIDKAFKLKPDCRDVLFLKGTIYDALGERFEAIDCYIKIIEQGESLDKKYNCSQSDLPFVKMIVNDANLKLYQLFKSTNIKLANKLLKKYKDELKKGTQTIYIPLENFI